jgi:hypothetical protein
MKNLQLADLFDELPDLEVEMTLRVGTSHSGHSRCIYKPFHGLRFLCEEHFPYNFLKDPTFWYHADFIYTLEEVKALEQKHGKDAVRWEEAWYGEDGQYMVFFNTMELLVEHLFALKRFDFQK